MEIPEKDKDEKESENKKLAEKSYFKYMSAGFQLVAPVIAGVLIGLWLDDHFHKEKPVYTIICASVMIVVALYQFIKQFLKR